MYSAGPLAGRVALVTGGGRGIGRAVTLRLAAGGAAVAVNYRRDEQAARATCDDVLSAGGRALAFRASVDDDGQAEGLVAEVLAAFGHVDVLVHNAGIASRGRTVVDTTPDELDRVLRTHAVAAFSLCRLLLPQMRDRGRGDVVLVSSVATTHPVRGGAPYMMGKAALEALAATLAVEEMPHGIRTNVVAPGLVATEMGDRLARAVAGVESATDLDAGSPYGRVCRPEDVADVVAFLVSAGASYVNGQRIAVDGGGSSFSRA